MVCTYLLSDTFVMTLKLFAIRSRAIPTPMSPMDRIPRVASGDANEPILNYLWRDQLLDSSMKISSFACLVCLVRWMILILFADVAWNIFSIPA